MKAIIYAGIGLFSAASVYGIVDYYNSKSNGTLDKMYKEEVPVVVEEKEDKAANVTPLITRAEIKKDDAPVKATVVKTTNKKIKKPKVFIRDFKFSNFSRGRILPSKAIEAEIVVPVKKETKE